MIRYSATNSVGQVYGLTYLSSTKRDKERKVCALNRRRLYHEENSDLLVLSQLSILIGKGHFKPSFSAIKHFAGAEVMSELPKFLLTRKATHKVTQ